MSIRRKEQTSKLAIHNLIQKLNLEEKWASIQIEEIWRQMMGPNIFKHTKKIHIENQILFIFIDSAAIRNELYLSKTKLLNEIHKQLKASHFTDIKFM